MSLRGTSYLVHAGAVCALGLVALAMGCRAEGSTTSASSGEGGSIGEGGSGASTTTSSTNVGGGSSTTTGTGGSGQGGQGGSGTGTGGMGTGGMGGGGPSCAGKEVSVEQIVNKAAPGAVGKGTPVTVKGVVATSKKFLVSQSSTSGSCLYGVFVSAPVPESAPYQGVLVVAYGNDAVIPPGGTKAYCGKISGRFPDDPLPGDTIPDDTVPGDILDITGTASEYIPSTCGTMPTDSKTPQKQLAFACAVTKTGTQAPIKPHVFTDPVEIAKFADQANADFHTQWGGSPVSLASVKPVLVADPNGGMGMVVVGKYGEIKLEGSNLLVGDKIYYRGYEKDKCFLGPVFTDTTVTWNHLDGLHYLNFCTWGLQSNNKCADFDPSSQDCVTDNLMCK